MIADPASGKTGNKLLWRFPWGYKESFLVALEIMLFGMIIEVLTRGEGSARLSFPINILAGLALITGIIFANIQFKRQALTRWLSSVPAAVSAISLFALLVLLQGFIPQNPPVKPNIITLTGLDHLKNSWLFTICGIYLLFILGSVIVRKVIPFRRDNLPFLLNHLGLWIALAAGSLGSGDLKKFNIYLPENGTFTSFAYDRYNHAQALPFSIRLTSFDITYFSPDLALIDAATGEIADRDKESFYEPSEGGLFMFMEWQINIEDYLQTAFCHDGDYFEKDSAGAAPAARVSAFNKNSGQSTGGWVSCGSYLVPHSHLPLGKDYLLVMTFPEVQRYSSEVIIRRSGERTDTTMIEVNKPCRISGWILYQFSYDQEKGKWSDFSVIEAVNDPWLPLVYLGIFLMLGGSVYMFWTGRRTNTK